MHKKLFLSTVLMAAAVAGSTPMISHAAYVRPVQISNGKVCKVYEGKDINSLKQLIDEICNGTGNVGNNWGNSCTPGTQIPGMPSVPGGPGTDRPSGPDTELPDTSQPGEDGSVNNPGTDAGSYAQQVAALVNAERAKAGLPALSVQTEIVTAANVRAKEIKQQFSHTRPDGRSFDTVLTENGVSFRGSGENIAYGQRSPEAVMEGWMNSAGHRANILNANFKNIGVGYYQDTNGGNHWVQLFTY